MTQDVKQKVEELPERLLVEVGLNVLGDNDIDDLSQAADIIAQRGHVPKVEVERLAEVAAHDTVVMAQALRILLTEIAATPEGAEAVDAAIEEAGRKQLVLGTAEFILISLLISGALSAYVAVRTGGRQSVLRETKTTFDEKGNIKSIQQSDKTVYVDPQSGFGRLLQRLLTSREPKDAS